MGFLYVFEDTLGGIQNCMIGDILLKKKHVAIADHKVRESTAANIVHPIKINVQWGSQLYYADSLAKSFLDREGFPLVD
jgi:hypothetical protein